MASKTKTGKKPVGRDRGVFDVLSVVILTVLSLFCLLPDFCLCCQCCLHCRAGPGVRDIAGKPHNAHPAGAISSLQGDTTPGCDIPLVQVLCQRAARRRCKVGSKHCGA